MCYNEEGDDNNWWFCHRIFWWFWCEECNDSNVVIFFVVVLLRRKQWQFVAICLLLRWCYYKEAWEKSLRRIWKHIVLIVFFSNGVAEKKAMVASCHCLLCFPLCLTRRRWWPFSCVHVKKVMTAMVVIDFIFWSLYLRKRKRWQQLHWCLPPKNKFGFFEEGNSFSFYVYMVFKTKGT